MITNLVIGIVILAVMVIALLGLCILLAVVLRFYQNAYRSAMNGWEECNKNWTALCMRQLKEFQETIEGVLKA